MPIRYKAKIPAFPNTAVVLLGIVIMCATAALAQPVRFAVPTNVAGSPGETVTIPLNIDPRNNAVGSFDATIDFKNTLLKYSGFTTGPILATDDNWLVDVNGDNEKGAITVGAFSFARLSGAGPAVLLKFVVAATAAGGDTARLLLRGLAATDTNAVSLPVESAAGKFTVKPAISGRIRNAAGTAISNVTLAPQGGENLTTDAQGYYRAVVAPGWSGTITPSKSGYTFDPPAREYTRVTRDLDEQDYLGVEIATTVMAFPSPFNPEAETAQIRFALKNPAEAAIKIYDGSGELVKEFSSAAPRHAGPNMAQNIRWDGRNGRGEMVANGVYFYVIEAPGNVRMSGKIGVVR
jgi:hypothetical protein